MKIDCRNTTINILLSIALAGAYALMSSEALAEFRDVNVEVKPLATTLTLLPGGTGVGGEAEWHLDDHLSAFGEAAHVELSLGDGTLRTVQEDAGKGESVVQSLRSTSAGGGARYYTSTQGDSWYGGAKLVLSQNRIRWAYDQERLKDDSLAWTTALEGGYRWIWDSGFLVRFGGGLAVTSTQKRDIRAVSALNAATDDAEKDVEDKMPTARPKLHPTLDFGLGWTF